MFFRFCLMACIYVCFFVCLFFCFVLFCFVLFCFFIHFFFIRTDEVLFRFGLTTCFLLFLIRTDDLHLNI